MKKKLNDEFFFSKQILKKNLLKTKLKKLDYAKNVKFDDSKTEILEFILMIKNLIIKNLMISKKKI